MDKLGNLYGFAHLTLQEYFAAEALKSDEAGLLRRFRLDPGAWRETLKLWCGLVSDSTQAIAEAYEIDAIAGFECLADARSVDEGVARRIIAAEKGRIGAAAEDKELATAFGAVATNDGPRGREVFAFLSETLADEGVHRDERYGAAFSLSYTNVPEAAAVLARHYPHQTSGALVRMGNLAIPQLREQAAYNDVAIDDLSRIATPEAAWELVPFLWHDNKLQAWKAAWYLAQLLSQGHIEDSLKDYPLNREWLKQGSLDWVWVPFRQPEGVTGIANRIAHLLSTEIPEHEGCGSSNSDWTRRIILPLCAIELRDQIPQLPEQVEAEMEKLLEQRELTPGVQSLQGQLLTNCWVGVLAWKIGSQ